MAKILMVKPLFPYPPHQGTRRVSLAMLGDLASEHEVTYLCQREARAEASLVPEVERLGVRVVAPLMPNHVTPLHKICYKLKNRLASAWSGVPEICLYWSNRVLRSNLERLGREVRPDLTILENWETFPLRRSIQSGLAVLLAHDAAFQIRERAAQAAEDGPARARLARVAQRYKKWETAAWSMYDAILCLTDEDRQVVERELAGRGPRCVRHLPVPVSGELFACRRPTEAGLKIGFMGSFRADFNLDALAHLTGQIWPAVQRQLPQAELLLAGNGYDGPLKREAETAGARWLGFVEKLETFFEEIDVLVVPLRFGGGVRIRILEALAAGVPVVASEVAVAGLGVAGGEQCAIASGADAIAASVTNLLTHPEDARELGTRGRLWCLARHSPEIVRPERLRVIREILETVRP